jgi:hypothetical protein
MTQAEWLHSTDAPAMLEALWEASGGDEVVLVPMLHRYFVACCRRIWRLLPQEASRRGIEVAERYLAGKATDEELSEVNWHVEGAAFNIDYNCEREAIERWVAEVRAIPEDEMAARGLSSLHQRLGARSATRVVSIAQERPGSF